MKKKILLAIVFAYMQSGNSQENSAIATLELLPAETITHIVIYSGNQSPQSYEYFAQTNKKIREIVRNYDKHYYQFKELKIIDETEHCLFKNYFHLELLKDLGSSDLREINDLNQFKFDFKDFLKILRTILPRLHHPWYSGYTLKKIRGWRCKQENNRPLIQKMITLNDQAITLTQKWQKDIDALRPSALAASLKSIEDNTYNFIDHLNYFETALDSFRQRGVYLNISQEFFVIWDKLQHQKQEFERHLNKFLKKWLNFNSILNKTTLLGEKEEQVNRLQYKLDKVDIYLKNREDILKTGLNQLFLLLFKEELQQQREQFFTIKHFCTSILSERLSQYTQKSAQLKKKIPKKSNYSQQLQVHIQLIKKVYEAKKKITKFFVRNADLPKEDEYSTEILTFFEQLNQELMQHWLPIKKQENTLAVFFNNSSNNAL